MPAMVQQLPGIHPGAGVGVRVGIAEGLGFDVGPQ